MSSEAAPPLPDDAYIKLGGDLKSCRILNGEPAVARAGE